MKCDSLGPLSPAAKLLDTCFVDPFDNDAANNRPRNCGIAEPPHHFGLDSRGRRIQDAVAYVIVRENGPDLPAIGTPIGVVHDNALAAPGLGLMWSKQEQCGRHGRNNEMAIDTQHRVSQLRSVELAVVLDEQAAASVFPQA